MNISNLSTLTVQHELQSNNLKKMETLFSYDTLDEADPKYERIRRDVTIEIGGPSTYVKTAVLTREEHTLLKAAFHKLFTNRITNLESQIQDWADLQANPSG